MNKGPITTIASLSLRASIKDKDLQNFIAAGCIKADPIADLTEVGIGDCV